MFEKDVEFRKELDGIIQSIESFCKRTTRRVQVNTEQQVRKDVAYTCGRLIPEMIEMMRILAMRNSELATTNDLLIQLCEKYKELSTESVDPGQ